MLNLHLRKTLTNNGLQAVGLRDGVHYLANCLSMKATLSPRSKGRFHVGATGAQCDGVGRPGIFHLVDNKRAFIHQTTGEPAQAQANDGA
ncbi:hypothetical protein D3C87_1062840 [compost metagenome]